MDINKAVNEAFQAGTQVLQSFIQDNANMGIIAQMAQDLAQAFTSGKKALACGNGGSACDALHFAEEFTGRFRKNRRPLPVIPLLETSHITCTGNDYGFDAIFSRCVEAYGAPGDILIAISTSGNSGNILKAVEAARKLDVSTFLFLGKDGGKLKGQGTRELIIQAPTTDRIQEMHMMCLHIIIEAVERIMFPENY